MSDDWKRLRSADPAPTTAVPPKDLLASIMRSQREQRTTRRRRRRLRGILNLLAVLAAMVVVGYGVAWATTGTSPLDRFERMMGLDRNAGLSVGESAYGLGHFSILEPMTDRGLDELPERLKHWLLLPRMVLPKAPPAGPRANDPNWKSYVKQKPGRIGAWGETTTDLGDKVAVVSMNGKVCIVFDRYHGGDCGTIKQVERRGLATTMRTGESTTWSGTVGLVTDRVATLEIDYPGYGEVPIHDNVFRVADIPTDRFYLLGRDQDGKVVTRIFVAREFIPRGTEYDKRGRPVFDD